VEILILHSDPTSDNVLRLPLIPRPKLNDPGPAQGLGDRILATLFLSPLSHTQSKLPVA